MTNDGSWWVWLISVMNGVRFPDPQPQPVTANYYHLGQPIAFMTFKENIDFGAGMPIC